MLFANSITISPDTLTATIQFGEVITETVTITNSNAFPVNLDISILEQPTANSVLPFYADRFAPESKAFVRDMVSDVQYQDENGNWVNGVRCGQHLHQMMCYLKYKTQLRIIIPAPD